MALNKVQLIGHLGADPEVRKLESGKSVAGFSIATTETWKNDKGEKQENTEWHNIVAWGGYADMCEKFLEKGKQVYIEGKLRTRSYESQKDGITRYITEIVASNIQMLGKAPGGTKSRLDSLEKEEQKKEAEKEISNQKQPEGKKELPFEVEGDYPADWK